MLENITNPQDIKNLSAEEVYSLCDEIRNKIVDTCSRNGGHLASNLGMVEASVVLHRLFDVPDDKIVFDVGHQCYAHKMLTGRYENFDTLRKKDGISGFTNRGESEYDTFTAGHGGSSVSASLGIASAMKLAGSENHVVCVVGDGSFTNGMIYEALNNCDGKNLKLIILLNDNEMSISSNVGSLASYLSKIRTSTKYFKVKRSVQKKLGKIPHVGNKLITGTRRIKNALKRVFLSRDMFFSAMGVKYFGPVNGNDIHRLEAVLVEAKKCDRCCLVHMKTKKGYGYSFAEDCPKDYHSVGCFDTDEGVKNLPSGETFSDVFGKIVCSYAENDEKVCAITAAMCDGTGLSEFSQRFPDRFFDVGMAEEHEIAFAGGLSSCGMKPVCALYSTFAQRVFDEVFHDVALQKLPCVIALDRAGFVPDDGATHQGLYDVSLFSSIPGCSIYSPDSYEEMKTSFDKAMNDRNICIVRYPKGQEKAYPREKFSSFDDGNIKVCGSENADVCIVTYGRITANAFEAARVLEENGVSVKIVKLVKIYPFDAKEIVKLCRGAKLVYLLEEGIRSGSVSEKLSGIVLGATGANVVINAVRESFPPHAKVDELYEMYNMDSKSIVKDIAVALQNCDK